MYVYIVKDRRMDAGIRSGWCLPAPNPVWAPTIADISLHSYLGHHIDIAAWSLSSIVTHGNPPWQPHPTCLLSNINMTIIFHVFISNLHRGLRFTVNITTSHFKVPIGRRRLNFFWQVTIATYLSIDSLVTRGVKCTSKWWLRFTLSDRAVMKVQCFADKCRR